MTSRLLLETGDRLLQESGSSILLHVSEGAVTFAFATSGAGSTRVTGSGAVAFSFAPAGSGGELVSGFGAVAFGFSVAAEGTGTEPNAGAVVFGWSCAGDADEIVAARDAITLGVLTAEYWGLGWGRAQMRVKPLRRRS